MNSCLYECRVTHRRIAPKPHRFVYRLFYLGLDLDELPQVSRDCRLLSINGRGFYSVSEQDYLPFEVASSTGTPTASRLKDRVLHQLHREGSTVAVDRIHLITLPRIAGYLFNPVSFYFCFDHAGCPVAALAEVTNTFGEVKLYTFGPGSLRNHAFRLRIPKQFYVSPFSPVDDDFDFALRPPGQRLAVQIDDYAGGLRTLTSTVSGTARPLNNQTLAWFSVKYPLLTLRVIFLIHWHALVLFAKRVPWFRKSEKPAEQRGLYRPQGRLAATLPHHP